MEPALIYRGRTHLGLVVFLVLLLFVKNAPLFLAGQFVSEDSFYFYETAYNADWLTALTTPYAGYLHVMPMLLAELLWHVPFAVLPWVNHAVSLSLCAALLSWFYTPYCRSFVRSDAARAGCVLLMALTPYQPNLGMLLGLHWYLSFTVGLILLGDLPRKPAAIAALSTFVVLAAWSAPATVVLIPVALVRWWLWRRFRARYVPLSFAAASIAYALAIQFVFKPGSPQPDFADPAVALEAFGIMASQGWLAASVGGCGLISGLPPKLVPFLGMTIALGLLAAVWRQRRTAQAWLGLLLLGIGGLILLLAMLRGIQSALVVRAGEPLAERYLTTPGFYLWTAAFVICAPLLQTWGRRVRTLGICGLTAAASLLIWDAPLLSGGTPLSEAFTHSEKAAQLTAYEERVAGGGQAETLALPGWQPMECMRLQVGGGRECIDAESLDCLFGDDLKRLGDGLYEVTWLGKLRHIQGAWYEHPTLGAVAPLGYEKGFYWLQDTSGQRYLTGPAIYPRLFEYPPKNRIWVRSKR